MKTLGLIGGTGWVSTVDYYRIINKETNARLGGLSSAKMILYSVNQQELRPATEEPGLSEFASYITGIAKRLESAGADGLILCANTTHLVADIVQKNIGIPIIHIADVTGRAILNLNMKTVGLLGTKITMEHTFYKDRLKKLGIATLVPDQAQREYIQRTIMTELELAIFKEETRSKYLEIIDSLVGRGAEGIVLGCTEIPLLVKQSDCNVPVFDTTTLHAMAAVEFVLSDEKMAHGSR